jgi:3-hydroxy-5-phosphonooxypentane-2,4-dione thiolase
MKEDHFLNINQRGWGAINRAYQFFKPDKNGNYHTVMLAIDHPYFYGPTTGLENPRLLSPLFPYADAISPAIGSLTALDAKLIKTPVILRISGGNSMRRKEGDELCNEHIITSLEEAVNHNAVGVSLSVFIGSEYQAQTIRYLGKVKEDAKKYGLLVLGICAVGTKLENLKKGLSDDGKTQLEGEPARYLAHAGRIIQENGADILKTYHCKDFEKVRNGVQIPIVIAGGKKVPEKEALEYTYASIQDGADGVDMGRNIFQAENPLAMIQAVRKVVHEGYNVKEAYEFYEELSNKNKKKQI